MKEKIIVMLSGGLDSLLVVKLLQEQNKEVIALYFKLPFSKDSKKEIIEFCEKEKCDLKVFDCSKGKLMEEYLDIIRKPKHGRGTCMNPCIDCRIFLLDKAKEFANKKKIKFIATGEVLDERPMSQNSKAMKIVEKDSELEGRLIRPLMDIGIRGRNRKKQIEIAEKFKFSYPQPAGGCLLCEKELKEKVKSLLKKKNISEQEVRLIKIGRHFEEGEIILGKNKQENKILKNMKGIKIIPKQPGPTALVKDKRYIEKGKKLIRKYSKKEIKEFEEI